MDIDGSDAFDRVLDKLLEMHVAAETARAEKNTAEYEARRLKNEVDNLNRAIENTRAISARSREVLEELWKAAKEALLQLPPGERLDRLSKALAGSAAACDVDEIPF